jgi:hypothetical protein
VAHRRRGESKEVRKIIESVPDYDTVVPGSNPAPPQRRAISVSL